MNVQKIKIFVSIVLRLLDVIKADGFVSNVLSVLLLHCDNDRFMLSFAIENADHSHTEYDQSKHANDHD